MSFKFNVRYILLLGVISFKIDAQSVVVPNLNTPVFNANSMNQTFNVANGMQSVGNWDAFIFQSVSILQTQWEAQVQAEITMMVNSVTTSDHFASVQDYQSYVYNSLQGQASEQLIAWQLSVENEILEERNQYVASLYGANSTAVQNSTNSFKDQWNAFINGNALNLSLGGAVSQAVLNNGQQTLAGLEGQWWNDFNNNLQSGLYTYQQALQGLTTQYQNLISQINNTEMQYQANLAQIQQSQAGVKDQILSSLEGYQSFLNGNGLFWNTVSVLYDNTVAGYIVAGCPTNHQCDTYEFDLTNSQFYASGECPTGHVCAEVKYDLTSKKYLEDVSCPTGHICDGSVKENLSIRTGLNADGKAFQNVINNVSNALQEGYVMPAIFDYTSGTLLNYNSNCLTAGNCTKGKFDSVSGTFITSNACPSGQNSCFDAIVDSTNPSSPTGSYFSSSCQVGDARCVTCSTGHVCLVQDMEAGFLYASNLMTEFLHSELLASQTALTNAIDYQNGTGNNVYRLGDEEYDNDEIASMWGSTPFAHADAKSTSVAAVSIFELLNENATEGKGGLAKQIMKYVLKEISESDLANWIMDAYSSSLSGNGTALNGITGLGPGITITGIQHADLRAFMNEDGFVPFLASTPYCPYWAGCYSDDIFNPSSGIYDSNRTFSSQKGVDGAWGTNFYDYYAKEPIEINGVPILLNIPHEQNYAWMELTFTTSNNNAYANVTTYQDLVLQLQSFEYDWKTNVMPSISNWTTQAATYQAQYANWQTQMQVALANAQATFNAGVQDIQNQESTWLAQMNKIQNQATSAFNAAQNALQNGQGQADYQQLTQQILAGVNHGQVQSNIRGELTVDLTSFSDSFSNLANGLNKNAGQNIPNFDLLNNINSSFNRAITGSSNLTLLSSTNNATMDTILGYMNGIAESMRHERQFTQNGFSDLIEAKNVKTKDVKTVDQYSGETITTTYVLNSDGTIATFTDKDGNIKKKTVQDWIQETCGEDLGSDTCKRYVENKYESVDVDPDGKITAHRNVYNGKTSLCGGDATNIDSYCFTTEDRVVTIGPPSKNLFLLGRSASRLGDLFSAKDGGVNDLVNSTFQNSNAFLSSGKHTASLFVDVNAAQAFNDRNSSIASAEANNKVRVANIIVDYVESVLMGGVSTKSWVAKQAQSAIQDVIATALVRTFDLPPDVAAFLSGGLMAHMEASKAKHDLGSKNFGIGKAIHSAFNDLGLEGFEQAMMVFDPKSTYASDLRGLENWKQFKTSMYGFAVQKYGESHGWSPEFSAFAAQYAMDFVQMKQAKEEFGRNGSDFSLHAIAGELKLAIANVAGMAGEMAGAVVKTTAHFSGDLGLTSEKEEKRINQNMRSAINDIKLKEYKDDIRNWDADQVTLASESVKEYGKKAGWDQETIDLWAQQASDFVVRKQAERELHKRDDLLMGGAGGSAMIRGVLGPVGSAIVAPFAEMTSGVLSFLVFDRKLFNGGLTTLISKGVKGVLTSVADLGNMFGESIVSSDFRSSVYDQTKIWHNTVTQEDVKARAYQGEMNKAFFQEKVRDRLFDLIGESLIPGDKTAAHNLGLLLKNHVDQQESKKRAKEQKLRDAETIAQVAAAAAAIYFSGGTASQAAASWLQSTTMIESVGLSTITNGQMIALASSTAVSMAVESKINGTNGAVAAFANGLISAATMGIKTPVTGYLTYTKHQNANLFTGQEEVKGGWGGGVSLNVSGAKGIPAGEAIEDLMTSLKMSNLSLGLSFNQDQGLGMNINTNFTNNVGLGLDYNFKSGNYTANASYDANKINGHSWANGSLNLSASKDGTASVSASYNSDDNEHIPQRLRGTGGTLEFSNDGMINLSLQGMKGATIASLSYDTNTHGFKPLTINQNFQNEFNQGMAAENSAYNRQKSQMTILRNELSLGTKMDKPLFTQAEIDKYLPKGEDGNIDLEKAHPEKLLEKWNAYKDQASQTKEGLQKWKEQVTKAGERSGIEIQFNDGKSATSTFGKFVKGLFGDIAQSFGFANDGSKMVDKRGVFRLDTCFVAGTGVWTKVGIKAIEEVKVGEKVLSWNEKTDIFETKTVTETFVHEIPQLFFLEVDGEEEIHTTWNHPFRRKKSNESIVYLSKFSNGGTRKRVFDSSKDAITLVNQDILINDSEWTKAEDLKIYDQILKSDGSWATITRVFFYNAEATKVYNLEVEDNHTYVVGEEIGVVVHNYDDAVDKMLKTSGREFKEISQTLRVVSGIGGEESFDPVLVGKLKKADADLDSFIKESVKYDERVAELQRSKESAQNDIVQARKANKEFLDIIRSANVDSIPGIKEIRLALKDIKNGFTEPQMEAIRKFKKEIETMGTANVTKRTLALSNIGESYGDPLAAVNALDPKTVILKNSTLGPETIIWKSHILDSFKEIKTEKFISEKETAVKLNTNAIDSEKKAVGNFLEAHQKSKQEIFDHIAAKHSENPNFEGILKQAGLAKKKEIPFWDLKAQADDTKKLITSTLSTERLSGKDNVEKTLRDKLTYTKEVQKLVWNNNEYRIGSEKGLSVYERDTRSGVRERISIDNSGHLDVSIMHKRVAANGKVTYAEVESRKMKLDGTEILPSNSSEISSTSPQDENVAVPRGIKNYDGNNEIALEIANSKKAYSDYMGLNEQQKEQRNAEMAKEKANTRDTEKKFLAYKDSLDNADANIFKIEQELKSKKLDPPPKDEDHSPQAESLRKKINEKKEQLEIAKKEREAIIPEFKKAYQDNYEAFAPIRKRMLDEDRALVSKFGKNKIADIEAKQKANSDKVHQLQVSNSKENEAMIKKLGDENFKLENEKAKWLENQKDNSLARALNAIDRQVVSSELITKDFENDLKSDKEAKFVDPIAEKAKYAEQNRITLKEIYEDSPEVIKAIDAAEGNRVKLEIGVLNLGVGESGQYEDFGAQIVVRADRDTSVLGGKNSMEYNPKTGAFEYIQDGRNTCQSYSLLDLMIGAGIKFKDSGRSLIQELTRLELKLNLTADMSSNTLAAYNKILAPYGFEAKVLGREGEHVWKSTKEEKLTAVKRALDEGNFVGAGMYIDGPQGGVYKNPQFNSDKSIKLNLGHRVTIIGYDDVKGEFIVHDSRFRGKSKKIVRYKYEDFGLVTESWSMVLQRKK